MRVMSFACGIPLYHPTEEQFAHIEIYSRLFEMVYIYDNTENGISDRYKEAIHKFSNVCYISTGDNDGLSHAYNVMCSHAIHDGYDYLAIYDQDSTPSEKYILRLINYIKEYGENDVAAYGPKICRVEDDSQASDKVMDVDVLISSGTFVNLCIYAKTVGFDEDFFIDKVDDDYCLMTKRNGYKIRQVCNCLLFHQIGEHKTIYGKTIEQHSPLRMYYISRNTMYLYEKYGKGKLAGYAWLLDRIRHVFLYDDDKLNKIKMMLLGARDYEYKIMGKRK